MKKKIFSFDAETDGLWGNPFAVAAIVYENPNFGNWTEKEVAERICNEIKEIVGF